MINVHLIRDKLKHRRKESEVKIGIAESQVGSS